MTTDAAVEVNFDGLVGPTHNYSGLSYGNVASLAHGRQPSNPREAARQGLAKMKALHDRGFMQGILPPHQRPNIAMLRHLGYRGSDSEVLAAAARENPVLLGAVSSASNMWTANAATCSPSADTADAKVHFTPANLVAKFHRSFEHFTTARVLKRIFADDRYFVHHPALPPAAQFGDEGAANHTRFCRNYGDPGVELFVYGRIAFSESHPYPRRFPARQTLEACQSIQRLHGLSDAHCVHAQQNPEVIDQGVFHNDVIAVGNGPVLFHHEAAFLDSDQVFASLEKKLSAFDTHFQRVCVSSDEVSLEDAVRSYLFNSQLLMRPEGGMVLLVPVECREIDSVSRLLDDLPRRDGPIREVVVMDLRESMKNGGGPACLRFRVVLRPDELAATHSGVLLDDDLYQQLLAWVDRHYRDRLSLDDLADPQLLRETEEALDELTRLLGLGSIYSFQKGVDTPEW